MASIVVLVFFGFRKQIGDRIRSMRHYEGPAGEIDFNETPRPRSSRQVSAKELPE